MDGVQQRAVTTYNISRLYATAVCQLSEALAGRDMAHEGASLAVGLLPLVLVGCASTGGGVKSGASDAPATCAGDDGTAHRPKVHLTRRRRKISASGVMWRAGYSRPGVPDTVPDEIPDVDASPGPKCATSRVPVPVIIDYTVSWVKKYRVLDDHEGYVEGRSGLVLQQ